MKKLLIVLVCLGLVGCASGASSEESAQDESSESQDAPKEDFAIEATTVVKIAEATKKAIDYFNDLKEKGIDRDCKKLDNILVDAANKISHRGDRQQFIQEKRIDMLDTKREIKRKYNEIFKRNIETVLENFTSTFRDEYVWAADNEKQRVLMVYEAILDILVKDNYLSIEEVNARKSKTIREWLEARAAYGR